MTKKILAILLAVASAAAMAQQVQEDPVERSRRAIDEAMAQAKVNAGDRTKLQVRSGLSPEELRRMKGVDVGQMAAKYRENGVGANQGPQQDLLIFVSTSMPKKALTMLGEQARATGAVLVLRGMKGPLGKPGTMDATMKALEPIAATGAALQINPEAFDRYNVTAVPTFVIAAKEEGCGNDSCATKAHALAGDVSLEYALEEWSNRGGAAGRLADLYLKRLARNQ